MVHRPYNPLPLAQGWPRAPPLSRFFLTDSHDERDRRERDVLVLRTVKGREEREFRVRVHAAWNRIADLP